MKRLFVAVLALIVMTGWVFTVAGRGSDRPSQVVADFRQFGLSASSSLGSRVVPGLWEGVDPLDGSGVQSSISDIDQDGVFEIIVRETFFTFCKDVGANGEFGILMSTGTIGEDGILRAEGTLTCDNGQEIMIREAYEPVTQGAILVLTDPDDPGTPTIILHRVSQPKRGAGNFDGPDDDKDED